MKGKNIIRFIIITFIILFISLYITQATGYYEFSNNKKSTLTNNAIKKFEQDVKKGKTINVKNYVEEEKNYNNNFSTMGINLSNFIEKSFNTIMNYLFNEMNKTVNSNNKTKSN